MLEALTEILESDKQVGRVIRVNDIWMLVPVDPQRTESIRKRDTGQRFGGRRWYGCHKIV